MTHDARPDPSAFFLEGGDTGVLLIHGFPGSTTDKTLVTLHNSGHNILVDAEWETVARKTYQFIEVHQ